MQANALTGWTIVFDLDGTLVDTAPDLHAALNHCLDRHDVARVPFDAIRDMIGSGAKAMIRKGLSWAGSDWSEYTVEALWPEFIAYYRANICRMSRFFPDAEAVIDILKAEGATCAVCTNKQQVLAEEVLAGLKADKLFAAIVGADAVPRKKPDGDHILRTIQAAGGQAGKAIMIGDSQTDERAARDAGLPFIFVPFGYGPDPESRAPELITANSYEALPSLIRQITA